ncbi:hypothetical protein OM076_23965 [Solirubrobacter ginsenosidimutans]|uniref:Peptidase S55 domain-containing protein n=1 Tax=Solirubrobacter ginsenosidimutans TaxID=490573 RepID=A0A9X3MXU3_9ACTN|nr:hypothetical protein [Solirubrobacter ginsenosidimutans]MDA0163353.1 hypothetical protein [Solirubrobacter ginsenosidimutans]
MRIRSFAAAAVAACLVPVSPAFAGDPTMPLSQVQAGMQCTGRSVIQGTTISTFDVTVLDVASGEAAGIGNILIQVSGPAVDDTGIGPGFSGSPIYCPDADGVQRVIGAISQSVNEYGGKIALATSIDAILGTPVDVPSRPASARMKAAISRAKPIASPLSVSGLDAGLANALTTAAAKAGRPVLAVPAGPLGTFPVQTLQPGSAVAVGYSNGDVRTSATGTVAYVDGDRIWLFGHELEGNGRRALLLQDAYVYKIINNPLQIGAIASTYKLAASGHDLGTVTNDGFSAVAGRLGVLPHTVPINVIARDEDANTTNVVNTNAADEAAVDLPSGGSWTSAIAPLAVAQAASSVIGSVPGRMTGDMCARITVAEISKPLRFCNRYVSSSGGQSDDGGSSNAVLTGAANDLGSALGSIDAFTGKPPRVTGVNVLLKLHRGADQAFIDDITLPARARRGAKVKVKVALQVVRGAKLTRTYTMRIPRDAKTGRQTLRLVGQDADQGADAFTTIILGDDSSDQNEGGDPGPSSLDALADEVKATHRFDGVTVRIGRVRGEAFRDADYRISGQGDASIRITR